MQNDDNFKFDEYGTKFSKRVENTGTADTQKPGLVWERVKLEARQGKSAIEMQKELEEVGSEFILPYSSITRWVRQFNNEIQLATSTCVEGLCRVTTGENVENVAKLLNDDRRYSCDEIARELGVSHESIHRILTERLQMTKIATRWVPHMSSENEKHQHVNIAR